MATNYLEPGQLPDGVVLAHTLYGEPDSTVTHAYTAMTQAGIIQLAPDSGIPYYEDDGSPDPRAKRCIGNDNTCMGWRITNSELCAAHAGLWRRHARPSTEVTEDTR
jgi:hypothetical protein